MKAISGQDEKKKKELLRKVLRYRQKFEQYRGYVPNGKAESFINMVGSDEHFINLFIAANGVGKTACLINILANICYGPGSKWFRKPLYEDFPYLKKGRIVADPTTISKTITPEIKKWFPYGRFTSKKNSKSYDSEFITDTGFEFDVMTYEQDVREFESATLGFALFDEPPPEAIFKATISRMRRGGIIIVGFTPLMGSAFFYDNYVKHEDTVIY